MLVNFSINQRPFFVVQEYIGEDCIVRLWKGVKLNWTLEIPKWIRVGAAFKYLFSHSSVIDKEKSKSIGWPIWLQEKEKEAVNEE